MTDITKALDEIERWYASMPIERNQTAIDGLKLVAIARAADALLKMLDREDYYGPTINAARAALDALAGGTDD